MLFNIIFSVSLLAGAGAAEVDDTCRACDATGRYYSAAQAERAWTGPENTQRYADLLGALEEAARHGLDPADYHLAALQSARPEAGGLALDRLATDAYLTLADHLLTGRLDATSIEPDWSAAPTDRDLVAYMSNALVIGDIAGSLRALAPQQPGYLALQEALAFYTAIDAQGGWPQISPGDTLRPGDRDPRVSELRARLAATWDVEAESADPEFYDSALADAVQAFQYRANLEADAAVGRLTLHQLNISAAQRVDQIRANLERWRWLPDHLGERHIRVNIADFRLEARQDGVVEQTHKVIVGRQYRRTPVFSGRMSYLVINPWWETPPSLAVRDKLPLFRSDPGAVDRLGFQVLDRSGNVVDPATIDWSTVPSSNFPYRLRQAPGPLNALGEIKFMFPNRHNVYLHDTPTRGLFARNRRDFSSGCVRVEDPLALADWVIAGTPGWDAERVRAVAEGSTETRVTLAQTIPVHILYWTVVPDELSGVRFVDDLYSRDGALIAALEASPPTEIN
ncbi:L,D-transpeptidase family protein [Maricaulis sp. CAU 1757]